MLNIRHRESLKVYLEKNVFSIDNYIDMLRRIKKLYLDLANAGYDPSVCVWDIDAVFVGGSISELEVVYPVLKSGNDDPCGSLTDLLAVASLHVFDSRDNALEALSAVVRNFNAWEKGESVFLLTSELFDDSIKELSAFASGSGMLKQYAHVFIGEIKKYVGIGKRANTQTASDKPKELNTDGRKGDERKKGNPAGPDNNDDKPFKQLIGKIKGSLGGSAVNITVKRDNIISGSILKALGRDRTALTDRMVLRAGQPLKSRRNGSRGLQSRVVELKPEEFAGDNTIPMRQHKGRKEDRIAEAAYRSGDEACLPVTTVIGRELSQDLFGAFCPYVSSSHAKIVYYKKKYLLTDTDSLNGTFLNDERLKPGVYYRLIKGDTVSFAHRSLSFSFSP